MILIELLNILKIFIFYYHFYFIRLHYFLSNLFKYLHILEYFFSLQSTLYTFFNSSLESLITAFLGDKSNKKRSRCKVELFS